MDLIENKEADSNIINSIHLDKVIVNGITINESCIISNNSVTKKLNLQSIDKLTSDHIEYLISSNPELILIGSGSEHIFPNTDLLIPVSQKNIGLEIMNNHSASITYNVLISEERQVACLIII